MALAGVVCLADAACASSVAKPVKVRIESSARRTSLRCLFVYAGRTSAASIWLAGKAVDLMLLEAGITREVFI